MTKSACRALCTPALLLALSVPAQAANGGGGVTFTDIALNGGAGINYGRVPSTDRAEQRRKVEALATIPSADWRGVRANQWPMKADGAPGVALLDYDNDGDVDIYATNGPGAANSLFQNQLRQTGRLTFVDVGRTAGVDATSQDSSGVCYGDIDNDGDNDLYVLATGQANRLFENRLVPTGQAVFTDITTAAGAAGKNRHAVGCSMADFNGDSLLDVVIANTYDNWNHQRPTFIQETYVGFEHNTLLMNTGGNRFVDRSKESGIETVIGLPDASLTWSIAAVDYDLDGDTDIFYGDSQGPPPTTKAQERGYNRLYENDGNGKFTDRTFDKGLDVHGSWMGFAFGDYNCDGFIDFFSTNLGDYISGRTGVTASRHLLGGPHGTFRDPGPGALVSSSFGWGAVATDYDNDGDTDIFYNGAMDMMTVISAENPGLTLQNQGCSGRFRYDFKARTRNHAPRIVEGVAVGDLNNDGFEDIVSVASMQLAVPNPFYFPWVGMLGAGFKSPLDPHTRFQGVWAGVAGGIKFDAPPRMHGDLSVEVNSANNGNGSVAVTLMGGKDIVPGAVSNRSGIGAMVWFTPKGGKTVMRPVIGGSSYASQDSLTNTFGLGTSGKGDIEILWPGGVRNKFYGIKKSERLTLPEIPCSYEDRWAGDFDKYHSCVKSALDGLKASNKISTDLHGRMLSSAIKAYREHRGNGHHH